MESLSLINLSKVELEFKDQKEEIRLLVQNVIQEGRLYKREDVEFVKSKLARILNQDSEEPILTLVNEAVKKVRKQKIEITHLFSIIINLFNSFTARG